jgi:hypothetical protein
MTGADQLVGVLVGPACSTCEADDLRAAAPCCAARRGRCPDCGTEYRWYEVPSPDGGGLSEPTCPGCGVVHDEQETGTVYCEDCGPSDCAYCGATTLRWLLSENLACRVCETGDVDGEAA